MPLRIEGASRDPGSPPPEGARLGRLLVRLGLLETTALERGLRRQSDEGGRIGTCLLDLGVIDEPLLLAALGTLYRAPTADGALLRAIPSERSTLLPARAARLLRAVPIEETTSGLKVALEDPSSLAAIDQLRSIFRRPVLPLVALEVRIAEALDRLYGFAAPERFVRILERRRRLAALRTASPAD